jgi:hypothetical protein
MCAAQQYATLNNLGKFHTLTAECSAASTALLICNNYDQQFHQ